MSTNVVSTEPSGRILPRREFALAFVCGGLLMLEICLTKIFSIVLWYHFGFLAVSTALLGFAAAGVSLALKGDRLLGKAADRRIAGAAAVAAITGVASLWLVTETTFDVYTVTQDRTLGVLLAFVLEVTLPFFFLGLVVARTLASFPERANTLYGADLLGSAAGCGMAVLVLSLGFPGQTAILMALVLVGIGGVLFAGSQWKPLLLALVGLAVPCLAYAVGDTQETFPLRSPRSKPYYQVESIARHLSDTGKGTWTRAALRMKDGRVLDVETPVPPVFSDDGRALQVETDDGEATIPVEDIATRANGTGLSISPRPWSPYRRWSSMARVDAFHWPKLYGSWGLWGLSPLWEKERHGPAPRQKGITIDAWAMTSILRWSGRPIHPPGTPEIDAERRKLEVLEYLPAGTVHRIKPAADKVLCIGAGGGLDLITAKYFGAGHVTGVEINGNVVRAAREAFPEFAGWLFDSTRTPDVDVQVAEGRHFLERTEERYDILQLSGVDTFSTTEAGAFALSENFLYTTEAFQTYLDHLREGGVLTLTRWFSPLLERGPDGVTRLTPRFSLRLLGLARVGLEERGVTDWRSCIFFLKSQQFTVILVKPSGFSPEDVALLRDHCAHYGFDVLWAPDEETPTIPSGGRTYPNPFEPFMAAPDALAYLEAQPFDVSPPRDDRPFFFEVSNFKHILRADHYKNNLGGLTAHGILAIMFVELMVLGLVFVVLPLRRLAATQVFPGARRVRAGVLIYFSAIGFAFIVVEIVLSQKFILYLGHPIYSLAVILFSVLFFSGLGAMFSNRVPLSKLATLGAGILAVAVALSSTYVFERTLQLPLEARIAIAVLLLAPVGFVMGVPFPTGVRVLARVRPELVPWAWSVNGYTSVLGSVLAVILGIELGFLTVLFIAAGVYSLGVIGYALMAVRTQDETVSAEAVLEARDDDGLRASDATSQPVA